MPEEKKTKAKTRPKDQPKETPEEVIKRLWKERGKTREQMAAGRAKRPREGGSWTVGKDGSIDKNGNDRRMGTGKPE